MSINIDNLHIKLQFNDEYRRFDVPRMCKYAELVEKIKTILSLTKDFTLKYKDDENEWITISSDIELETGLTFVKASLLRLLVCVKSEAVKNESVTDESEMPPWRRKRIAKWREWKKNRENCEEGDEGDCKKWRGGRRWRKNREECEEGEGDCKKWRGRKTRKWDCEEKVENEGDCHRKKKGRRYTDEERESWKEEKRKRREEKRRKFDDEKPENDTTSTTEMDLNSGDELLTLEQIKKEIELMKTGAEKLREKNKIALEGLNSIRRQMKEKRKAGALEEVLSLKGMLKTKKEEKFALCSELKKNLLRIKTLNKLASKKG